MSRSLSLHNVRIWTGDNRRPWAHSVTIKHDRIESLDQCAQVDRVIDGKGQTVTPGLIDSHMHLLLGGQTLKQLDLTTIHSRTQFEQAIAARHQQLPPDRWLIAHGWSEQNWTSHEQPDKTWLRAAGDRPAVCYRMDQHACVVNEAVLKQVDISQEPTGGRIVRDQTADEPTGLFVEAAAWSLINPLIPTPDVNQRQAALSEAMAHANQFGLTTVGSMEYAEDIGAVFEPLRGELTLRCRLTLLDRDWPLDFSFGDGFENDDMLAVIGYKAFLDGTLGSRSARMLADYSDDPGNRGMLLELASQDKLTDWAVAVARHGYSPSMHAIGDAAVRLGLDAIEPVDPSVRPRIEHAQQIDEADVPRFRGVIASMQPLHRVDDGRYALRRLGQERMAGFFAFRRLLECGTRVAFGSDWPIVSCNPLLGIQAAVTGRTAEGELICPNQNLTVEQALRAYTTEASFALGFDEAGVISPGKLGDLVMWDRDPFAADWEADPPSILMTIVGGRVVKG